MGLTVSLMLVFLAFCLLMAAVLHFCLRESRRQRGDDRRFDATIDHSLRDLRHDAPQAIVARHADRASPHAPTRNLADDADDERVAIMVFGSIILGALLAILTGYLVFFRDWAA